MSASPADEGYESIPPAAVLPPAPSHDPLSDSPADVPAVKAKRKYRRRPETNAKREIKRAQKKTNRVVPAKAIDRVAREIAEAVAGQPLRFAGDAVSAIHEAAEAYLIDAMAGASANAAANNRKTITSTDLKMGHKMTS